MANGGTVFIPDGNFFRFRYSATLLLVYLKSSLNRTISSLLSLLNIRLIWSKIAPYSGSLLINLGLMAKFHFNSLVIRPTVALLAFFVLSTEQAIASEVTLHRSELIPKSLGFRVNINNATSCLAVPGSYFAI